MHRWRLSSHAKQQKNPQISVAYTSGKLKSALIEGWSIFRAPSQFSHLGGSSPASHPPLQPQGRHVTGNPSPSDRQPVAMGINLTLPLLIGSLQESWRVVFVTPRSVPAINKIFGGDAVGLRACIPTIKHKSFSPTGGVQASYGTRKLWSVYIFICINAKGPTLVWNISILVRTE